MKAYLSFLKSRILYLVLCLSILLCVAAPTTVSAQDTPPVDPSTLLVDTSVELTDGSETEAVLPQEEMEPAVNLTAEMAADNSKWMSWFGAPDIRGQVIQTLFDSRNWLYIIGDFHLMGGMIAGNILMWNGTEWSNMNGGADGEIYNMAADQNGNVYISGAFTYVGGVYSPGLARWDGTAWSSMGVVATAKTTYGPVAVSPSGKVYLGRLLDGNYQIDVFSDGISQTAASTFLSHNINPNLDLAVNSKDEIFLDDCSQIRKWSGSNMEIIKEPLTCDNHSENYHRHAMFIDQIDQLIFMDTVFYQGYSTPVMYVFDPFYKEWSVTHYEGFYFKIAQDIYRNLYYVVGTTYAEHLMRWDGEDWNEMFTFEPRKEYFSSFNMDKNGSFYYVYYSNGRTTIKKLEGTEWACITEDGEGFSTDVTALAADDQGGLYVGGMFYDKAGVKTSRLLYRKDDQWINLDPKAHLYAKEGSATKKMYWSQVNHSLYILNYIDNSPLNLWDGTQWQAVAMPKLYSANWNTFALDRQSNVYLLGEKMILLGTNAEAAILRRDGSSWTPLLVDSHVRIDLVDSDAQGNLYAAGNYFDGDKCLNFYFVARQTPKGWYFLGNKAIDGKITDMKISPEGIVYIAGDFDRIGKSNIRRIAYFDDRWRGINANFQNMRVNALALDETQNLYIAGRFNQIGGVNANNIVKWNYYTQKFTPLGSGTDNQVLAMAFQTNGLYVGGSFSLAGGKPAAGLSCYGCYIPGPQVPRAYLPLMGR